MSEKPAVVSVIIPIFNAEPYLEQCLESIVSQTYPCLDIICLNDGSTDNSLTLMQKYAQSDSRIRIIDKQNQGYGATCNRGLIEAQGAWISVVEPDDWIESGMYADMLSFGDSFVEPLDIIKTPYWRIVMPDSPDEQKLNCSYKNRIRPQKQPFTVEEAPHLLSHHPSIWSALYRKEFLENYNIRFREYPGAGWADNPFLIETLCQAKSIAYLDQAYYCYREETQEKTHDFSRRCPTLPFDRWLDMTEELQRIGVTDDRVWRAHNSRGFTYAGAVFEVSDKADPQLCESARRIFSLMDENLVYSDPELSPGSKRLYARILGKPEPRVNKAPYLMSLFKQGCYMLKNVGIGQTAKMLKRYLSTHKSRQGE